MKGRISGRQMEVESPRGCVIAHSIVILNSEFSPRKLQTLNRSEVKIYANNIKIFSSSIFRH